MTPDATGHFHGHWIGAFKDDCSVELRRPKVKTVTFSVMTNCTHTSSRNSCVEVTLHAVLP